MKRFQILQREGKARLGKLKTAHGEIDTPNFIPVGTQASVKSLSPQNLTEIGIQAILANTYHLMLRPGIDVISKLGGLHKFMGWERPIMTDSGGFQVLSLGVGLEHGVGKFLAEEYSAPKPRLNKVTEKGVIFQSHIDGSKQFLDAEKSIDLQLKLGADLIVVFDDLESPKYSYQETLKSLERSERWELRSLKEYRKQVARSFAGAQEDVPLLYGVTHGGEFKDLRVRSARFVDQHFEGIALGGAHKDRKNLYQVVDWTLSNVTEEKPRHLLGIGEIVDLFEAVDRGVDLFDCAAPTRRARHGSLYTHAGNFITNIKSPKFKTDKKPTDPNCKCYTCQNFSRGYLRHLFTVSELLYYSLASYHNIHFITDLMREIRKALGQGRFKKLKQKWLELGASS